MPIDPLSRARVRLGIARIERDWFQYVETIGSGTRSAAETARKRLREALLTSVPVFKASKFFLNPEMTLADCTVAPLIWRLESLGIDLPKDAHVVLDYGERIFRNPGYARSLTEEEKSLRSLTG
jgi:RNA polymerase-associated protein